MTILSYPYRPKPWVMFLACLFFGGMAYFMGHEAMVNDRGLILNGIVHLEPHGATIFYWCVAAIGAVFVAIGVPALFVGLLSSHQLILTATDISAPKYGFSKKAAVVKLADITHLSTQTVQKQHLLNIHHANGKLTISASFLPNQSAFEELCSAISSRIPSQR